jgi:hypothetical protein
VPVVLSKTDAGYGNSLLILGAVTAFEMKLRLLRKLLEYVNPCHFSSSDLLHKNDMVSVPFPTVRAVEMTGSLAENLKRRFNDFSSRVINTRVFEKKNSPVKFQVELQRNCNLN